MGIILCLHQLDFVCYKGTILHSQSRSLRPHTLCRVSRPKNGIWIDALIRMINDNDGVHSLRSHGMPSNQCTSKCTLLKTGNSHLLTGQVLYPFELRQLYRYLSSNSEAHTIIPFSFYPYLLTLLCCKFSIEIKKISNPSIIQVTRSPIQKLCNVSFHLSR